MEVSRQLHALAALLPKKSPLVPIGWESGWTKRRIIIIIIIIKLLSRTLALERGGSFHLAQTHTEHKQQQQQAISAAGRLSPAEHMTVFQQSL
jgi:hypothetical protein